MDSHLPLEGQEDRYHPVVVVVANHLGWSVEEVQNHCLREDLEEVQCRYRMVSLVAVELHGCCLPLFGPTMKQGCQTREYQMPEKHWVQQIAWNR